MAIRISLRSIRNWSYKVMKRKEKAAIGSSGSFHDTSRHKKKKEIKNNYFLKANMQAGTKNRDQSSWGLGIGWFLKMVYFFFKYCGQWLGFKKWYSLGTSWVLSGWVFWNGLKFYPGSATDHDEGKKKAATDQPSKSHCCGVCFDSKPDSHMFRRCQCNHPFCTDCISTYVATKIQQNILKVECPNPKCSVELEPKHLQTILPEEVIDRWEFARYESSIAAVQKTYCPFKNCSALLVNDGGKVVTSSECPSCHRLFCAQCKVPWHAGMDCKEFQKLIKGSEIKILDRKFLKLAKGNMWKKCPKCYMYVQRHSGCEHMTCRCGCEFCYNCGKNWKYGHLCIRRWFT